MRSRAPSGQLRIMLLQLPTEVSNSIIAYSSIFCGKPENEWLFTRHLPTPPRLYSIMARHLSEYDLFLHRILLPKAISMNLTQAPTIRHIVLHPLNEHEPVQWPSFMHIEDATVEIWH